MSKQDKAKVIIQDNRNVPLVELKHKYRKTISGRTFDRANSELNGNKESKEDKKGETRFKQEKDGSAEYAFNTQKRIVSKDDLVEVCDIDLSEWEIERWICNKWEVGAKDAADKIQVTPLFQIKLWLKPKFAPKQIKLLDAIEGIVKQFVSGSTKPAKQAAVKSNKALKATVTDMHVGLDPNPNDRSLFRYKYSEKEFNQNLDSVYATILQERKLHGKFDVLFVNDLGDGLDGWNGLTTRGNHKLEQNLDNVEQFRAYVAGKLRFIENLIKADVANRIEVISVTDDNHSGDFAHTANLAIQMILERVYSKAQVEYKILKRFIEHFSYGEHTFLLTHGKDAKSRFRGLPFVIRNDANSIKLIEDYIDRFRINTKYVHVEKGDLHSLGYEKLNRFDYRNFMSFAPPSSYVQNNYGDGYSGYSIQVIDKVGSISHTDYFFDISLDAF